MASVSQLEKGIEEFKENVTIQFDAEYLAMFELFSSLDPKIVETIFSTVNTHKVIKRLKQRVEKQKLALDELNKVLSDEGISSDQALFFAENLIPTSESLQHMEKESYDIKAKFKEIVEKTNDSFLKTSVPILYEGIQELYDEVVKLNQNLLDFIETLSILPELNRRVEELANNITAKTYTWDEMWTDTK